MTRARKQLHLFTCTGNTDPWLSDHSQIVSPFMDEMNLAHNLKIAKLLHNHDDDALMEELKNNGVTSISRRYLKTVKPNLAQPIEEAQDYRQKSRTKNRTTARKTIAQMKGSTRLNDSRLQLNRKVCHAIFGDGRVTQVNDDNFVITFQRSEYGSKRFARIKDIMHLFEW